MCLRRRILFHSWKTIQYDEHRANRNLICSEISRDLFRFMQKRKHVGLRRGTERYKSSGGILDWHIYMCTICPDGSHARHVRHKSTKTTNKYVMNHGVVCLSHWLLVLLHVFGSGMTSLPLYSCVVTHRLVWEVKVAAGSVVHSTGTMKPVH